jgi:hypothetical protein
MSRWSPTAALLAALVLSCLAGCGPSGSATSAKGGSPTTSAGPASSGKSSEAEPDTGKGTDRRHDPR